MSEIVKCDICGRISSKSYLASHTRLAHGKLITPAYSTKNEAEALEVIISLFAKLSDQRKKEVRDRLSNAAPG